MSASADDIETFRDKPASASTDAGSATSRSADDFIKLDQYAEQKSALDGTNDNGGPKSLWSKLRPARVVPPGGA